MALESLVTRPYDPTVDILYIPLSKMAMFFNNLCGNGAPAWLYEVCHVATPFPPAMVCRAITWALMVTLSSLRSLSIVFPNTPERLNSLGGRTPPPRKWAGLRVVEDAEMDEFSASSDTNVQIVQAVFPRFPTDGGRQTAEGYHIQMNMSIRDQLATVVAQLNEAAANRDAEELGRRGLSAFARRFSLQWSDLGVDESLKTLPQPVVAVRRDIIHY